MTLWGILLGGSPLTSKLLTISLLMEINIGQLSFKDMKGIKLLFIAMEAGLIIGLAFYMWHLQDKGTIGFVEALLAFMMAIAAITFQKEQQEISWDD